MKRFLSALLAVIMLLGAVSITAFADDGYWKKEDNLQLTQGFRNYDSFKLGDVDDDGNVNAVDALAIAKRVLGYETELSADAADFDADGKITAKDRFCLKSVLCGEKKISAYDNGQRVQRFTIGGVDISEFTFVLPKDTNYNDNIYFAYELLYKYIQKTTGVTLTKVYGDFDGHAIRFHNVDLDSEMGQEFGDDGYTYKVENGNLEIYGATRGNMYASYEIIEKYLGIFFGHIIYTASEKLRCSDIPEGLDRTFITPSKYRICLHTFGGSNTTVYYGLARHHNSNIRAMNPESYYGYYTGALKLNAHSFYYYNAMANGEMPPEGATKEDGTPMTLAERYYQKFLNGGGGSATDAGTSQPCASSEATFEHLYSGLMDLLAMMQAEGRYMNLARDRHMVSFSINDNAKYCTCSMCQGKINGTRVRLRNELYRKDLETYEGDYELSADGNYVTFKKESMSGTYMNMINKCADRINELYPGMQVFSILYDGTIPATIRPRENMVLCYCANIEACAKCRFGDSENCNPLYDGLHSLHDDEINMAGWGEICRDTGAELYVWYYPENYTFYLFDVPKFFDMYYDFQWFNEAGVVGYLYEGVQSNGPEYTFCALNAYLASEMMWNPEMSYDEYIGLMQKYLRMNYDEGWEHIYNYIVMLDEASEQPDTNCGGFYYRAFDMYSKSYISEHYEEMRAEVVAAIEERDRSNGDRNKFNLENILMNCELLGLSASYDRMYTNGNAESRKTYEERYTWLYNYIKDNNLMITDSTNAATFKLPATISFNKSPMIQIYQDEYRNK